MTSSADFGRVEAKVILESAFWVAKHSIYKYMTCSYKLNHMHCHFSIDKYSSAMLIKPLVVKGA